MSWKILAILALLLWPLASSHAQAVKTTTETSTSRPVPILPESTAAQRFAAAENRKDSIQVQRLGDCRRAVTRRGVRVKEPNGPFPSLVANPRVEQQFLIGRQLTACEAQLDALEQFDAVKHPRSERTIKLRKP